MKTTRTRAKWKGLRSLAKLMSDIGQHELAAELLRQARAARKAH